MAKKESSLVYGPIRKELNRLKWPFDRIESPIEPGIPDLNIGMPGKPDWWLELKYVDAGALVSSPEERWRIDVGLRREQFVWLRQAVRRGRSCGVVLRLGDNWYLFTSIEAWEMMKSASPWSALQAYALQFKTAGALLQYLSTVRPIALHQVAAGHLPARGIA